MCDGRGPLRDLQKCVTVHRPQDPVVPEGPVVVVVDLLCKFYALGRQYGCTTDQLMERLLRSWYQALDVYDSRLKVFVACIDQPMYRELSKLRYAKQRKSEPPVLPYGPDVVFTREGVIEDDSGVPGRISIDRLLHHESRQVRDELWNYMSVYISRHVNNIPPGCYFILDYEVNDCGPLVKRGDDCKCAFMPHHAHQRAEADLALPYWTLVFGQEYPVIWRTSDSDVLATGAWLLGQFSYFNIKPVYWQRFGSSEEKEDALVNLSRMGALLSRGIKVTSSRNRFLGTITHMEFWLLCVLMGTDYTDKKFFSHGVGVYPVTRAIGSLPATCDLRNLVTGSKDVTEEQFTEFITAFAECCSTDEASDSRGKAIMFHFNLNKKEAVKQFNDIRRYWCICWDLIPFEGRGRTSILSLETALLNNCAKCMGTNHACMCSGNPRGWWEHRPLCHHVNVRVCTCCHRPPVDLSDPVLPLTPPTSPPDDLAPIVHLDHSCSSSTSKKQEPLSPNDCGILHLRHPCPLTASKKRPAEEPISDTAPAIRVCCKPDPEEQEESKLPLFGQGALTPSSQSSKSCGELFVVGETDSSTWCFDSSSSSSSSSLWPPLYQRSEAISSSSSCVGPDGIDNGDGSRWLDCFGRGALSLEDPDLCQPLGDTVVGSL